MQTRHVCFTSMFITLLASVVLVAAEPKGKEEGKSARDDQEPKSKEVAKKGQDLGARVDALERQVRELVAMLKGQKEGVVDKTAAFKKTDARHQEFDAIAAKNKMKAAIEAKLGLEKKPVEKKPAVEKAIDDGPMVIKGQDGQLYVRLSALPPEYRKKFGAGENEKVADPKHQDKTKKQDKDDDDDDRNEGKKPGKQDKD